MKTRNMVALAFLGLLLPAGGCRKQEPFPKCLTGIIIGSTDGCNTLIQVENVPIGRSYRFRGQDYTNVVQTLDNIDRVGAKKFYFTYREDDVRMAACVPYPNTSPVDLPYVKVLDFSTVQCP